MPNSIAQNPSQSHVDYLIEVAEIVSGRRDELAGYRIVEEPERLRHFTARLAPVGT